MPKRRSFGSLACACGARSHAVELVNGVENCARDLEFVGFWNVLVSGGGNDRDLIGTALKADFSVRDVVDDERIQTFALQLRATNLDRVRAVLGGKANQRLILATGLGKRREDIRCWPERQLKLVTASLLDLPFGRVNGREVGDCGGHKQKLASRELLRARLACCAALSTSM